MSKGDLSRATKILFVDCDETSFEVRRCMAKVLQSLPPVELFHAHDATEALTMLDQIKPDVIVIDDEVPAEKDLFIDSLSSNHPPIVVRTESEENVPKPCDFTLDKPVTYIPKSESLDGIHQTLLLVSAIGVKACNSRSASGLH